MKSVIAYNIGKKIQREIERCDGEMRTAFILAYEMLCTEEEVYDNRSSFALLGMLLTEDYVGFLDEDYCLYKVIDADSFICRLNKEMTAMSASARLAIRLVIEFVNSEQSIDKNEADDDSSYDEMVVGIENLGTLDKKGCEEAC